MSPTVPSLTWSCFSYTSNFRIHVKVQMILQIVMRPTCVILSLLSCLWWSCMPPPPIKTCETSMPMFFQYWAGCLTCSHGCHDCMFYFFILCQAFNKCFDPVILFIHFSLSFEGKMPWYVVYRGRIPSTSRNVYINDLSLMTPKILVTEQAHSMTKYLCSSQLTSDAGQAQRMVTKCLVWS
jgi:hypothetical protein